MLHRGEYHHHKSRRWMGAVSLEAGRAGRSLVQRPRWERKAESGGVCGEGEEIGDIQEAGWKSTGIDGLWRAGEKGQHEPWDSSW